MRTAARRTSRFASHQCREQFEPFTDRVVPSIPLGLALRALIVQR